jgi:cytochrome c-type biogenesis protein CcsB
MTVNESLANTANLLLYGSMVSYTGALLGYTTDLAGGTSRVVARAQAPTLVSVGAGAGSVGGSPPQAPASPQHPPQPSPRRRSAAIGTSLTALALLLHVASVLARGIAVQRPPWGNMFEFSTAGAAAVSLVFLGALRWRDLRYLGAFVVGPVLLTLGLAITVLYTRAGQLVPALRSVWLAIHVSVAFIASAMLTLAFSLTVLYLVQERRERRRALDLPVGRSFLDALPLSRELDTSAYQLHAVAFPLWTFTLVAGAIWAESAWGRYWGWDPKEVWTFVIWVVYAGYLHARATRGWQGRRAAVIALVGFGCLLFNFLVVNVFFVGFHSYGGIG